MSQNPEPIYSIIVPAYNEERLLPATLEHLQRAMRKTTFPGELIVVDNNSTDRTGEIARNLGARVIFEPENQISRARNTGARAARGNYLIFVDADTFLDAPLLGRALALLNHGTCCGGGAVIAFDRPVTGLHKGILAFWTVLSRCLRLAAGCFVFCRKDAFDAIGGFSERVYASEEIWLSRRMRQWGRKHGQSFQIIQSPPITTSARKMDNPRRIFLTIATFALFPLAPRFRRLSWFWYQRES
jgi:glycosyltransferase involved in cell wall biosynthesis